MLEGSNTPMGFFTRYKQAAPAQQTNTIIEARGLTKVYDTGKVKVDAPASDLMMLRKLF